ncbi:MAG: hypothetical protein K0Q95_1864 [Bacteroidota bacterium]|jgi:PKD repeat protein|nr:hypothetical protein [Bacteroidota bacterium]
MKKKLLLKAFFLLSAITSLPIYAQVNISSNTNNACAPATITFNVTSGSPTAYEFHWNFNDGSPVLVDTMPSSVSHVYTYSGFYNIMVDIYSSGGVYQGSVGNSNGTIAIMGANINMADSACIGDMVNVCPNGNFNSVSWNFGDPASGANNTTNEFCTQHAFSSNGIYTVTMTANTQSCGMQTVTKTIVIGTNVYPQPSAYANPNPSCPAMPVMLGVGGYSSYVWNFNDPASGSNSSTLQNPSHTFSGLGVFTPTVTVTNGCGKTGSAVATVNIVSSPAFPNYPGFSLQANSPACPNSTLNFNSPQGYNSYTWNFGDGTPVLNTTTSYNSHLYTTAGSYNASVTITSACGNDTTLTKNIVISNTAPFPAQNFQLNATTPACPNSFVSFDAPDGNVSYEWHFGDGSPVVTTSNHYQYHQYGPVGNYNAFVVITNGCGNDTTLTKTIQILNNVGFPNFDGNQINVGPNPACQGDAVGFNAPSGYASYTWTFGDGNSSALTSPHTSHTYTATGTYNVSLTIVNNCGNDTTLSGTIVVNNTGSFPNWLQLQIDPVTTCPNDLVEMRVNQGGYASYAWNFGDGSSTTSTGEGIQHAYSATGSYVVTCVITNGCGLTTTVTGLVQVTNSSPVNPELTVEGIQNPSCQGDEVFFVLHGGQSTYGYTWNFGDGSPATTTNGSGTSHSYTATGTYNVTVNAVNGCGSTLTISSTVVISNSAIPSLYNTEGDRIWGFAGGDHNSSGGVNTAGCAGDAIVFYFEGSATSNSFNFGDGNSGTAVDQLVVYGNDGAFPVTIIRHAFSAAGNYLITLNLTNSCGNTVTDTMTIHIGGGIPVSGDMTTSPPPFTTCASIDFLAFGGETYDWNFGDGSTLTTSSSTVSHTFASAGVYVVSVEVTNGCGNTAIFSRSLSVNGTGGPAVSLSSSTSPTCVGGSNGSATISVSSGQAPYIYAWNDPSGQATANATGLSAGLYYATVTDAVGCSSTLAVSINDPSAMITSVNTTTTACGAATGSATVSISSGGSGTYNYLWSTGITNATATGLSSGTYSVTVTDVATGCSSTATAAISENGGATLSLNTVTNVNCYGGSTGAININVTGGTAPYTYLWSNAATTQNLSDLAAGTYSVTVTDNSGCHAALSVNVTQSSAINVTTSVMVSPTCGNFDGQATVTANGGNGPYTYLWDSNAADQTTQTASGLPAGTYSVVVTDVNGCTSEGIVDLSNSNAPNITAVTSNVSCYGGSNGAVNITVTGGTSPYLYTWNVPPPQTNHQDVNNLTPGNYLVFVNDAHGCMSFRSYTISQPELLTASVMSSGVTCGNVDGTAIATSTGGNTSFTYMWTPGGQTTQTATALNTGSYTVTVTDNKGCTATASTTISSTTNPQEICMVTVDPLSTHNIIYWEKPAVSNIDSFFIYREDVTNVYTRIGAVSYDSLSEYHDLGANPNMTTKRYKISVLDNCGNESVKSNYHNTLYIVDNGSGQFTWNPLYTIENNANPVNNYRLMRDDNNSGSWNQVGITAGTQNTLVDPNYGSYPNGSWYVETLWGITCESTRATVNTTRSNIKQSLAIGIPAVDLSTAAVYPNPASDNVMIKFPVSGSDIHLQIMNSVGQVVYNKVIVSSSSDAINNVNTSSFAKGIYTVVIKNKQGQAFKKLIIN